MMNLGLFMQGGGHHIAAWRDPAVQKGATLDVRHYAEIARIGERGLFDFLFTADTNAIFYGDDLHKLRRTPDALRLEPITLLSSLAVVSGCMGVSAGSVVDGGAPVEVAGGLIAAARHHL